MLRAPGCSLPSVSLYAAQSEFERLAAPLLVCPAAGDRALCPLHPGGAVMWDNRSDVFFLSLVYFCLGTGFLDT